jgi:hypothetical protein
MGLSDIAEFRSSLSTIEKGSGYNEPAAGNMIEPRRIRTDEWQVFKTLRLSALEHDGEQFGQS